MSPPPRPKIVLLGDSLTQLSFSPSGFGAHVQNVYQRRADVLSRGMSGYNTDWFLNYIENEQVDVLHLENVVLVIIFFGANDSSDSVLNPRPHVPLPKFKTNLQELIDKCRQHFGSQVCIVMIACPPVHHEQRLEYQKQRYGDKATGELERNMTLSEMYSTAAQQVAQDNSLPCLNLFREMLKSSNWDQYLCDGLHFSNQGNEFVGKALVEIINENYPQLQVKPCPITGQYANSGSQCSGLRQSGPYHDELSPNNASKVFEEQT